MVDEQELRSIIERDGGVLGWASLVSANVLGDHDPQPLDDLPNAWWEKVDIVNR